MAGETTRLTIELEVLLRNLNRTLRGLNQIEQRLRRVAAIRVSPAQANSTQRATAAAQRLALAQQRLQLQQQRLQIATQNVANAQGRATVAAGRLALAQQRLARAQRNFTNATARLGPQMDDHVRRFRSMEQAARQFNRTLTAVGNSFRSIGQGLASVGATLTFSVTAPLIALGNSIVDAAVRMDSLRRGLTTMAGSSREANIQLERLTQLAKLPGIGFEEAIQGSIRLQAVGFSAAEAERALRQFSNAIALTGGGREDLANVTVQLGQMAAQSLAEKEFQRLDDERLRRIADVERAINNRNISEAEGLLLIRRINGEYVGDLERQLQLLKEIAAASGDANLQRQAQAAEETVKDANDRLASFGKQLRSTAIDAARSSFVEFFQSLRDSTISAKDRILNLIDSVVSRINEVIAENLFDELMKSIFGDGSADTEGGILAGIKRLFGFGGGGEQEVSGGDLGAQLLQSQTALETGAVTAATTLTTAAATAAATETTAAAGFATAIAAAASGFVAAITAAGAAFAAAVAAASTAQGFSSGLSAAGGSGIGNFAVGDLIPARRGGVLATIAEGGYPEAVLTTDPKHAQRQLAILRAFLSKTRGLGGRIPGFAIGDFVTPDLSLNIPSVSIPSASFGDADLRGGQAMNVRILNLLDKRQLVGGHLRSAEGTRDIFNIISENADEIGRRLGIK